MPPDQNSQEQASSAQPFGKQKADQDKQQSVSVVSLPSVSITKEKKSVWNYVFDWGPWIFNLGLVVVGILQVLLLRVTWREIGRQADIQEANMTQWVDLQPDGLLTTTNTESPRTPKIVTINPRWRIVNNTPLPFTLETIEAQVGREADWEVSEFVVDEVVPPARDGQTSFTFFVPIRLTETETAQFLAQGVELSIMIDVIYRGASKKREKQSFGDFYVCEVGKLEINKPIGRGPQSQRMVKDDSPSTLVAERVRIIESEREAPSEPT